MPRKYVLMDPDLTLRGVQELIRDVRRALPGGHVANDLADRVEALDEWLTRGGFYPDAWQSKSAWERDIRYRPRPGGTLGDGTPVPADYDPEADCDTCGRKGGH